MEIDLEPREYRGAPEPGQPFFLPGGRTRLLAFFISIAISLALGAAIYATPIPSWIRAFACTISGPCPETKVRSPSDLELAIQRLQSKRREQLEQQD